MPTVRDLDDLHALAAVRPPMSPGRWVRLDIGGLGEVERQRWERWLGRAAGACGCHTGAAAGVVFLVVAVVGTVSGRLPFSPAGIALLVVGAFVSMSVGKLVGIVVGRIALRGLVALLARSIVRRGRHRPARRFEAVRRAPR